MFAEKLDKKPTNYNKWIIIPVDGIDRYLIYNNGTKGYLNVYNRLRDNQRRDVFVGIDRIDQWKFHVNDKYEVALQNIPTGEFLYAIIGKRGENPHLDYPRQSARSIYTWDYGDSEIDSSARWIVKENCK